MMRISFLCLFFYALVPSKAQVVLISKFDNIGATKVYPILDLNRDSTIIYLDPTLKVMQGTSFVRLKIEEKDYILQRDKSGYYAPELPLLTLEENDSFRYFEQRESWHKQFIFISKDNYFASIAITNDKKYIQVWYGVNKIVQRITNIPYSEEIYKYVYGAVQSYINKGWLKRID